MRNVKLILGYDGTDFNGWQTQPGYRTVQETLEQAIEKVTQHRPFCNASGRTDGGVHALGQVVNFYTPSKIETHRLVRALNFHLPNDVKVSLAEDVVELFDANKDAISKLYRYVILDGSNPSPFMYRFAHHSKFRLDAEKMQRASRCLLGRHDFHSFETEWPNRLSSIRTILHLSVNRVGEYIWIDIAADGFLYNMVRAIAGTLINVGRDFWPEDCVASILLAEDRTKAGPTASPEGLYLVRVQYDDCHRLVVSER
jgi:tRNA pseudouridine38-40 synthase